MLTEEEARWLQQSSPIWLGKPLQLGSSAKLGHSMRLGNVIELPALLDLIERQLDELNKADDLPTRGCDFLNAMTARIHDAEDKAAFTAAVIERFIGD